MRICRFNDNRVGIVEASGIRDVTGITRHLPRWEWPFPCADLLMSNFDRIAPMMAELAREATLVPLGAIDLLSPIANPGRIIGIGQSYREHIDEAGRDPILSQHVTTDPSQIRMFFKSSAALVGPGQGIKLRFPDQRTDPELELSIVIGRRCEGVSPEDAARYIAGYTIGLDITLRGSGPPSGRKSIDTYAVLGPWLITSDELPRAGALEMILHVNGQLRQRANTKDLLFSLETIVSYASTFYSLSPGDVIMTGTPAGVAPIKAGDVVDAAIQGIGSMIVPVSAYEAPMRQPAA